MQCPYLGHFAVEVVGKQSPKEDTYREHLHGEEEHHVVLCGTLGWYPAGWGTGPWLVLNDGFFNRLSEPPCLEALRKSHFLTDPALLLLFVLS